MAVGAAIAGVGALVQTGFGLSQYFKGKKAAENLVRPEYQIPPEVAQNLSAAEMAALEGLPAQQKQEFVENIQRGGQQAMASLTDRGLAVAGASGIFQQQTDQYRSLLGADVAARQQAQGNLAEARLTSASFAEKQQQINEFQPYQQDYLSAQAQMGAGMQNIGLGFGSLINTGSQFAQGQQDLNQIQGIYGAGGNPNQLPGTPPIGGQPPNPLYR